MLDEELERHYARLKIEMQEHINDLYYLIDNLLAQISLLSHKLKQQDDNE